MKMSSIARCGSEGNRKLLSKYGGSPGSGPGARNHYARGGAVHSDAAEDRKMVKGMVKPSCMKADGGAVDGEAAPKRLDRPGRKMKAKGKDKGKDKKGADVNIVIMTGGKDAGPAPMPSGPPPGAMAGPPAGPPPPPMPMRKHGGSVKKADGGRAGDVVRDALAGAALGGIGGLAGRAIKGVADMVKGGSDKKNAAPSMGRASGGSVPHMKAGAGGGKGRLEKMEAYGKNKGGKC